MNEILPGVVHWTVQHERIGIDVSSYYLVRERVAIDPMLPAEGLAWFEERGTPTAILLTNRHHYRASGALVDACGCTVHCHRAGLHEFSKGERALLLSELRAAGELEWARAVCDSSHVQAKKGAPRRARARLIEPDWAPSTISS